MLRKLVTATDRLVKTVLYGLSAHDALTIATSVAVITAVSALAGYLPARRASYVDPMEALRQQKEQCIGVPHDGHHPGARHHRFLTLSTGMRRSETRMHFARVR